MTRSEAETIAIAHVQCDRPQLTHVVNAALFTDATLAEIPDRIRKKFPSPPFWSVALNLEEPPDEVNSLHCVCIFVSDTTGEVVKKT